MDAGLPKLNKAQRKRAKRGVCFAFKEGKCTRGDDCKFWHAAPDAEDDSAAHAKRPRTGEVGDAGGAAAAAAADAAAAEEGGAGANKLIVRAGNVIDRSFDVSYAADACGKPGEDLFIYRHRNGICIVGLAMTHPVVADRSLAIVSAEFRSSKGTDLGLQKVTGKKKKGGAEMNPSSHLCVVRCTRHKTPADMAAGTEAAAEAAAALAAATAAAEAAAEAAARAAAEHVAAGLAAGAAGGEAGAAAVAAAEAASVAAPTAEERLAAETQQVAARAARVLAVKAAAAESGVEDVTFLVRACVQGSLLEVNEALLTDPALLRRAAATEGYVAILLPRGKMSTLDGVRSGGAALVADKRATPNGLLMSAPQFQALRGQAALARHGGARAFGAQQGPLEGSDTFITHDGR